MLNLSYSDFKNSSWVNWLDPVSQVNQNFDKKIFKEIEFEKIQLNLTRSKILKNLSYQLSSKKEFLKKIFEKDSNGINYVGLNTQLTDNLISLFNYLKNTKIKILTMYNFDIRRLWQRRLAPNLILTYFL